MSRVLILHTGGTLAMRGEPLEPDAFANELTVVAPEILKLADIDSRVVASLDSSDVGPEHWIELAREVESARGNYDGVVVVHGTDTMSYTASALSFALKGLDIPVVLTGAQRPLAAVRTDARRNIVDAVEMATHDVPEVGVCFDGLLLRGCRATKSNSLVYRAFESPGCAPLARLGVDVNLAPHVRRPNGPFECDPRFDSSVLLVQVFPGMEPSLLERMLDPDSGVRGVVLVAFGLGTVPTTFRPLSPVIKAAADAGVEVLVVSISAGAVNMGLYKNSLALMHSGAVSGGSMGVEAALTKLMHALAAYPDDRAARRRYLEWDVAGELS